MIMDIMGKFHPITVLRKWVPDVIQIFFSDIRNISVTDDERVRISSRLLNISEFRFFQISYSRCYGREISEREMEPVFSDYMMKDAIPHWVRHFSREVFSRYLQRVLDPNEYNIQCMVSPIEIKKRRWVLPVFMTFIYLILYLILSGKIVFT
jgi:hypothetical protein